MRGRAPAPSVTAFLLLLTGCWSCLWATASAQVNVHIITPATDHAQVDVFLVRSTPRRLETEVSVWVDSAEPIRSVVASAGARSEELTDEGGGGYFGYVDLAGLSDGEQLLSITATTESGVTGSASRPIIFDYQPDVTIFSPQPGNVIRHSVRVRASCRDNSAEGCTAMRLGGDEPWTPGDSLERLIDLSAFAGQCITLGVHARDIRGNVALSEVEVCVEPSGWLREVISSDGGPILAFDGERAIFRSCDGARLLMRDRAGVTAQISDDPTLTPIHLWNGRVALSGRQNSPWGPASLWHEGVTTILTDRIYGTNAGGQWLVVGGLDGTLTVYDLSMASDPWSVRLVDSSGLPASLWGLTANGRLLLSVDRSMARLVSSQGTVAALDQQSEQQIRYLMSDGTRILAVSTDGYDSDGNELLSTRLVTGEGTVETLPVRLDFSPLLHNGWIAYDVTRGIQHDLRVRAVDGTERLVGTFAERSVPRALSDAGELMYANGSRLYRSAPGAAPRDICLEQGRAEWRDGWYVTLGQAVYRVLDTPDPVQASHVFEACAPVAPDTGAGDAGAVDAGVTDVGALADAGAPPDADAPGPEAGQVELDGGFAGVTGAGGDEDEPEGEFADAGIGVEDTEDDSEEETEASEDMAEADAPASDSRGASSSDPEFEKVSWGALAADAAADGASEGEGGGCSIGTSPRTSPSAALALIALVGLLVHRRRRAEPVGPRKVS